MLSIPQNIKQRTVLFIGSNDARLGSRLARRFDNKDWRVFRIDETDNTRPDVVSTYTDLENVPDNSFDAVWIPELAQRLYVYDTMKMLKSAKRVLKVNGAIFLTIPDIYNVAEAIIKNGLEGTMFQTASKMKIRPYDLMYGYTLGAEKDHKFIHKSGYVAASIGRKLHESGFCDIKVNRDSGRLFAEGFKRAEEPAKHSVINIIGDDVNENMRNRDNIENEPKQWDAEGFKKALIARGIK